MEEKVKGIVIGSVSFGENDKILTIFTLEKGAVTAKIKGVKKAGAKLKFATEPFCFAEYVFSFSQGKRTVIGASLIDSFYPLREDMKRYFSAGTVIEFLRRFMKENILAPNTFLLTVETLRELAYGENYPLSQLAFFINEALKQVGYGLNLGGCAVCGCNLSGRIFFDYQAGGFYCLDCANGRGREISSSTYFTLKGIVNKEKIKDEEAVFVLRLLDYYLVNKAEENLKSIKELIKL